MAFGMSDELLSTFAPIGVYWVYSGLYYLFSNLHEYRLHPKGDEDTKNIVSKSTVIQGVLLQQAMQIAISLGLFTVIEGGKTEVKPQPPFHVVVLQFIVAMFVLDTWQYFVHRYMHMNKFLYKHIHAQHHRLIVPYAYGALYNHLLEGLLMDTTAGALAFLISGMTPWTSIFFFSFTTVKSINDHSGLWLPGNPLNLFFDNNSAYHDVHHQLYGNKFNFSQPFFVVWDRILGTYMPYSLEKRKGGGLEARPIKD